MFERFTDRARHVVVLAQEEARGLKHNYTGTEHILLGLLREQDGIAARVLASLGITLEQARAQVVRMVGVGEEVTSGQIPFTPRAKKVLELALREALSLGHDYIGTEHILLGLVRAYEGDAARILLDFDASPEQVRDAVIRVLPDAESRARGGGSATVRRDVGMNVRSDFGMIVGPDHKLQRLLMAAGGRALADERHEFGLDDLLAAAAEMHAAAEAPDAEAERADADNEEPGRSDA